jgi:hypothetical protein
MFERVSDAWCNVLFVLSFRSVSVVPPPVWLCTPSERGLVESGAGVASLGALRDHRVQAHACYNLPLRFVLASLAHTAQRLTISLTTHMTHNAQRVIPYIAGAMHAFTSTCVCLTTLVAWWCACWLLSSPCNCQKYISHTFANCPSTLILGDTHNKCPATAEITSYTQQIPCYIHGNNCEIHSMLSQGALVTFRPSIALSK